MSLSEKQELTTIEKLTEFFAQADRFVLKNYMNDLSTYEIVPIMNHEGHHPIVLSKISKIVYDRNEHMIDKLSSVYSVVAESKAPLIYIIQSDGKNTHFYIGTTLINPTDSTAYKALTKSFQGNFTGSILEELTSQDIPAIVDSIFSNDSNYLNAISCVSGIASLRDNDKEKFVQGIEKFVDAMKGEKYSVVFISEPLQREQLNDIRLGYENLYTQLSPYATSDINLSKNESAAITESISTGFSQGTTKNYSETIGHTTNISKTETGSENRGRNIVSATIASIIGGKTGTSKSTGFTEGSSDSLSGTTSTGENVSQTEQKSNSNSITEGESKSLQVRIENKSVKNLLEKIDEQLKRLKSCEDLGMWNCAAYFIAEDAGTAHIAASTYKALTRGENSSVEVACINTWCELYEKNAKSEFNNRNLAILTRYLKSFRHPFFKMPNIITDEYVNEQVLVSPASLVSGRELAIQVGLPLKAVSGLPVMEAAIFGRDIVSYGHTYGVKTICFGHIFHMGSTEESTVDIDVNSLTMHTFVTGATGSGKSNAVYQLIDKLHDHGVKFLIIEPAKGEYKKVFGGREKVNVFGTNPAYSSLVKLNPFSFNENIHILEHIDRLVEIFNACWPMYAAMPAVLKDAIEQIYIDKGWDLKESLNYSGQNRIPGFADLLFTLPKVIKNSDYSDEMKGNYSGALVTRVKSLTNGIYGEIFTENEIPDDVLFNQDCIVDLSRVSSPETKALIMGILVMKMHEHRFSNSPDHTMNQGLNHITILEEAHHLLRKTSIEQSPEGANIQGKAVEMISNAIAEMRTFGEGFIIVDQSPGLMDMSVIRNTNTKVILRLPDESDRILVGKAANLNNEQIVELAKLKVGVAAIYQNNWLQPVLCQIDPFQNERAYEFKKTESPRQNYRRMNGYLIKLLFAKRYGLSSDDAKLYTREFVLELIHWVAGLSVAEDIQKELSANLEQYSRQQTMALWNQENFAGLSKIIDALFPSRAILQRAVQTGNFVEWNNIMVNSIRMFAECNNVALYEYGIIQCLLRNQAGVDDESKQFYFQWTEYMGKGA